MALILRVDVDKPFGNHTLPRKIISKIIEDYYGKPLLSAPQYLSHLKTFLENCNAKNVPGFIYHRICTCPNDEIINLLKVGGHKVGLHAENTTSYKTFSDEVDCLNSLLKDKQIEVDSFSKHGSGQLKLGKHHYPFYEPEKYLQWAKEKKISFYFGNDIGKNESDFILQDSFFPSVFWIEREYRSQEFSSFEQLLNLAEKEDIGVLIHPCNYVTSKVVADDFNSLIELAKQRKVAWKVF